MGKIIKELSFILFISFFGVLSSTIVDRRWEGFPNPEERFWNFLTDRLILAIIISIAFEVVSIIVLNYSTKRPTASPETKILIATTSWLSPYAGKIFLTENHLLYIASTLITMVYPNKPKKIEIQRKNISCVNFTYFLGVKEGIRVNCDGMTYTFSLLNPNKWFFFLKNDE